MEMHVSGGGIGIDELQNGETIRVLNSTQNIRVANASSHKTGNTLTIAPVGRCMILNDRLLVFPTP